jgi:hypothetical protein
VGKMDKEDEIKTKKEAIVGSVLVVLVMIAIIILFFPFKPMQEQITYIQCCNSSPCSDTYYNPEDNQCHLVLCENNNLNLNKSKCSYSGANVSINLT